MKKTFKRAGVAVLSMAMLLSMGAVGAMTASAAGTIKIETSTGLKSTDQVVAYRVATISGGSWTADTHFSSVLTSEVLNTLKGINEVDNSTTKNIAYQLQSQLNTLSSSDIAELTKYDNFTLGEAKSVEDGYYLVIATKGNSDSDDRVYQPMLACVTGSDTLINTAKASTLTLNKYIAEATGENVHIDADSKKADVEGGSTVTYTIKSVIPRYNTNLADAKIRDYRITDTPESTLYLTEAQLEAVQVYIDKDGNKSYDAGTDTLLSSGTNYSVTSTDNGETGTDKRITSFTVTMTPAQFRTYSAETLAITFKSTLSDTPNYGSTGNNNHVNLKYDNDFTAGSADESTTDKPDGEKDDDTYVYTTKLLVKKYDTTTATPFGGVTFKLYRNSYNAANPDTNLVDTLVTDTTTGQVNFTGLSAGTYVLVENTPSGYVEQAPVSFTIADTSINGNFAETTPTAVLTAVTGYTFEKEIINTPTGSLPGTGGMGTVLFTVGGAAIVMLAGVLFVAYMRKRKNEE